MGRASFEGWGRLAETSLSGMVRSGRFNKALGDAAARVPGDVAAKLSLQPSDTLLDVGCGPGIILLPLSTMVQRAVGVDHALTIGRLATDLHQKNVELIAGNFLDLDIPERFSKILIYSVLHYLASGNEAIAFLEKAAALLGPEGRLLIGDIPNVDLKRRFLASDFGQRFQADWERVVADGRELPPIPDAETYEINDAFVMRVQAHFRGAGFHAWLLPQVGLPLCHTREDLLIAKP